jgi:proton-translocating NADH-quinone oxidoreductase chain L
LFFFLFLPLTSFIFIFFGQNVISNLADYFLNKRYPAKGLLASYFYYQFTGVFINTISSAAIFSSWVCSLFLLYVTLGNESVHIYRLCPPGLDNWISGDFFIQDVTFQFDALSAVMLFVITFISLIVHLYSFEYLGFDPFYMRFMSFLNLFTFFMMLLVTSGNIVQMFIGWEGVGLSSYLLINFWFTRQEANKSSLKAIIMNKFGDAALFLTMFIFITFFGTASFSVAFTMVEVLSNTSPELLGITILGYNVSVLTALAWLLLIAAFAKSAQLGLHTWLPDAMEGPTPVSALLHAATMVTAGIYTIVRFSYIFEHVPSARNMCIVVGSLTALFGSMVALFQFDIKRVIAFSTTSQLGYMFVACGLSGYHIAMYHLVTHAFFKAFLFLTAGVIIHNLNNEQDIRKMGRLSKFFPVTYIFMLVGFLSLSGMPFLSGFYSKDAIIELAYSGSTTFAYYGFLACALSAFFTACYSVRILYYTFFSKLRISNVYKGTYDKVNNLFLRTQVINDISRYFLIILLPLFFGSIFAGYALQHLIIGMGTTFWGPSMFVSTLSFNSVYYEFFVPGYIKSLPILLSFGGYASTYCLYSRFGKKFDEVFDTSKFLKLFYNFMGKKWLFDTVYNKFVSVTVFKLSRTVYTQVDKGYLEYLGPYGIVNVLNYGATRVIAFAQSELGASLSIFILYLLLILSFVFLPY